MEVERKETKLKSGLISNMFANEQKETRDLSDLAGEVVAGSSPAFVSLVFKESGESTEAEQKVSQRSVSHSPPYVFLESSVKQEEMERCEEAEGKVEVQYEVAVIVEVIERVEENGLEGGVGEDWRNWMYWIDRWRKVCIIDTIVK